ncbi:DUF1249 domain-containing protein [SAR86 cluster bacterium]|nr:DUF1249 domain-containing protein [SAR86 cluster bacterium]
MIKNKIIKYKHSKRGLNQLLRLYERNYLKLIHFFPIADHKKSMVYLMPEGVLNKEIKISCKKLSSHTSVIKIYKSKSLSLLQNTEIEIYVYDDAKMAEVRKFNGKRQFWLRNKYPNKNMLSKDEKFQWNFFLEEFLTHTKTHGLSILKDAL